MSHAGAAVLALLILTTSGCGGGGSSTPAAPQGSDRSDDPSPAPEPAAATTGISVGVVTGFGSVFVNGIEFETGAAIVLDDGVAVTEDALDVGDLVRIEGSVADDGVTGIADRILYDAEVKGPITSIEASADSFVVLGMTVVADRGTVFAPGIVPASLAGLAVGDRVEVSGFGDGGTVLATRIEPEDSGLEIKGRVASVDGASRRLTIAEQRIDFSAADLVGFGTTGPEVGQIIEARGSALDDDGTLAATLLEREASALEGVVDDDDAPLAERPFALEGIVSAIEGEDLTVGATTIRLTDATLFEDGTRSDVTAGVRVEISGLFDEDAIPVAQLVEFSAKVEANVEGRISLLLPEQSGFELLGIEVMTSTRTQFEDDSGTALRRFAYTDLGVGDFVEVRGRFSDGVLEAQRVERDDDDDDDSGPDAEEGSSDDPAPGDDGNDESPETNDSSNDGASSDEDLSGTDPSAIDVDMEIEGIATSLSASAVTLNGLTFTIETSTRFEILDQSVSGEDFLAIASAGDRLEIDARRVASGGFVAVEIELEDAEIERRGAIEAVTADAITISGDLFLIDAHTRLRADDRVVDTPGFLELATPGVIAELEARPTPDGPPIATEIQIELESEAD